MTRVPKPPHVHVKPDDRLKHDGSKFDRDPQIPIGVKVRYGIAILVAAFAAFVGTRALDRANHVGRTTHESCVVQKLGLEANLHLTKFVQDVGLVLANRAPNGPAQKLPGPVVSLLDDMQTQATDYSQIEAQQPKTRTC